MVLGNTQKGTIERQKQKAAVRDAIEHAVKLWRYKNRLNVCGVIRKYIPDAILALIGVVEFIPDSKLSDEWRIFIIIIAIIIAICCFIIRDVLDKQRGTDDSFIEHLAEYLAKTEDEQRYEYDKVCYPGKPTQKDSSKRGKGKGKGGRR